MAILIIGLAWPGVQKSTILVGLLVLACPLLMVSMHGVCAQEIGFSGEHNPGMLQGASGWDGASCHGWGASRRDDPMIASRDLEASSGRYAGLALVRQRLRRIGGSWPP